MTGTIIFVTSAPTDTTTVIAATIIAANTAVVTIVANDHDLGPAGCC